ncbi:MAG TPA: metallophosphoesterase family protein [Bryobacteraceae bacterium]|nr:metallophosphoesterase family protein [Bryobacteraceae bacterium]
MRYLVISDIHANLEALQAVLSHAEGLYDGILNCGDLVGYGPDPNAIVDWCRAHTPLVVRGNHDKACVQLDHLEWFNPAARDSAVWTNSQLTEDNREYLRLLPQGPLEVEKFQILHGSPGDEDEYLVNVADAEYAARFLDRQLSFFGHTHVQGGFYFTRSGTKRIGQEAIQVEDTAVYLINPGSVGQPRDHDPRAAYAIFSTDNRWVEYRRVEYDIARTQAKIQEAGLPPSLAERLHFGV